MLNFRRRIAQYCEVWFDEPIIGKPDIVNSYQRTSCPEGAHRQSFHTLVIDLLLEAKDIFKAFSPGTRNEVRRAERSDELSFEVFSAPQAQLATFCGFYNEFAQAKGLPPARADHLRRYSDAAHLVLTRIVHTGEAIVWHAYYCAAGRARLLHSASLFRGEDNSKRNLIGRANRYLHWCDIQHFKAAGYRLYDLGGWSPPELGDIEKQRIGTFKEGFGGRLVSEIHATYAVTAKGRVILALSRLRTAWKARRLR